MEIWASAAYALDALVAVPRPRSGPWWAFVGMVIGATKYAAAAIPFFCGYQATVEDQPTGLWLLAAAASATVALVLWRL
jgi:hypothetical protein